MSKEFEVACEVILPATPEQAWDAVNTADGIASWLFPTGAEGAPEGEGAVWGGHVVLEWDPPHHSKVRMDGDGFFNQLEHTFEPLDDGTLRLRYVHSGIITAEDWDAQYDGIDQHTAFYLHSLGQYLEHFTGQHAAYATVDGPAASTEPGAFARVLEALGAEAVGDSIHIDVEGIAPIDGVIDYLTPHFLGIRTSDALYRFYGRDAFGGAPTSASHHLFAADADVDAQQAAWGAWLEGIFASARA